MDKDQQRCLFLTGSAPLSLPEAASSSLHTDGALSKQLCVSVHVCVSVSVCACMCVYYMVVSAKRPMEGRSALLMRKEKGKNMKQTQHPTVPVCVRVRVRVAAAPSLTRYTAVDGSDE